MRACMRRVSPTPCLRHFRSVDVSIAFIAHLNTHIELVSFYAFHPDGWAEYDSREFEQINRISISILFKCYSGAAEGRQPNEQAELSFSISASLANRIHQKTCFNCLWPMTILTQHIIYHCARAAKCKLAVPDNASNIKEKNYIFDWQLLLLRIYLWVWIAEFISWTCQARWSDTSQQFQFQIIIF